MNLHGWDKSLEFGYTTDLLLAAWLALCTMLIQCNSVCEASAPKQSSQQISKADKKIVDAKCETPQPAKKFLSVDSALKEYAVQVREKLKPIFNKSNLAYPPSSMTWIILKQEKLLLVFAKDRAGKWQQLLNYPIIGASGTAGPKLKEGDKQVPEGFYQIDGFRPNVIAHLGLSVNYPNQEDRKNAKKEGRQDLGKDILIHGSRWSTGCLAMGNPAIEELFVLTHDTGCKNIQLIFSPCNLLTEKPDIDFEKQPKWLPKLYAMIREALQNYPLSLKPQD